MKKQFFSKLLMAAMFVTAVGSFQSCKDYDGDINIIRTDVATLQGQKDALSNALSEAKASLATAQAAADKAVAEANKAAEAGADANAIAKAAQAAVDELAKTAALKNEVENLQNAIDGVQALIEGKVSKADYDNKVAELSGSIAAIDNKLLTLTEGLPETIEAIVETQTQTAIAAIKADVESQKATLDAFKASVNEQLAGVIAVIGEENMNVLTNLNTKIADAEEAIASLQAKIADNAQSIKDLQETINNTVSRIDKVNSNITEMNVFVSASLTSLVLKPTLYYGGIEAVEAIHGMYQPLGFSVYYQDEYEATNGHQDGNSKVAYDHTSGNAWDITYEYAPKNDLVYKYPTIDAYYHVNPKWTNRAAIGSLALNTEDRHYVDTSNTRAEKNSLCTALDVTGADEYYFGDGLLHAKFTNSADMWHRVEQYAHTVTVASLEATATDGNGDVRTVTSDWAAIARVHQYNYTIADNDAYILHYDTYPHIYKRDETDCGLMDTQQDTWTEQHGSNTNYERDIVHVYRQARDAIIKPYTHVLKWDSVVDLSKCIELHANHRYYDANTQEFDFPVDTTKLGFHYRYTLVDYEAPASLNLTPNYTKQSRHAHIVGGEWGHILKANAVTNNEERDTTKTSRYSIGREPLVMIEVLDYDDVMTWNPDHMNWEATPKENNPQPNLVAVGFIKFKIIDEDPNPYQVINLEVDMQKSASVKDEKTGKYFSNMYASCDGDMILTDWVEIENQILDKINQKCNTSISKNEFEKNYIFQSFNGQDKSFSEIALLNGDVMIAGQVYIPQTNKTSVIGTRKNWVEGSFDDTNWRSWVLPQVVLNGDITDSAVSTPGDPLNDNEEKRFIDPSRYGNPNTLTGIVYTNNAPLHRATGLIGVRFSAEQMLQQLVKRDHEGNYLDSLGNKVQYLSEADFYPYVLTKVAGKLVDASHNGWPEITLTFNVKVNLNQAEMIRPSRESSNGNWYAVKDLYFNSNVNKNLAFVNANIDAFKNGVAAYNYDVRRFTMNLQQNLKTTKWHASTHDYPKAFDFKYSDLAGNDAAKFIAAQQDKQGKLHGDLYFYTQNWLGDLEEGTPYWHDGTYQSLKNADPNDDYSVIYDKFYADKYLIKVCYTANPLDTVVWSQQARPNHKIGKLGKYLYAYKYIEDWEDATKYGINAAGDDTNPNIADPFTEEGALTQNYSHYNMAAGQLIAWIDNIDTHHKDAYPEVKYDNRDADDDINENVVVHYNFNSKYAQDLLNRAGRYTEGTAVKDGYSNKNDNPFSAHVHLNLFQDDCQSGVLRAINPKSSEFDQRNEYLVKDDATGTVTVRNNTTKVYVSTADPVSPIYSDTQTFYHRPYGVPVMLNNADFVVRFERPLNVEFEHPTKAAYNAVADAEASAAVFELDFDANNYFLHENGRIFPQDWRGLSVVKSATPSEWIQFYQGKPGTSFNAWNTGIARNVNSLTGHILGYKFNEADRSSWKRSNTPVKFKNWMEWISGSAWYYQTWTTDDSKANSWNSYNVVPQVDHMLTNYGGTENFYWANASQINMVIIPRYAGENINGLTFRYLNDNVNRGAFDVLIPVTVKYAWGDITTTGKWQSTTKIQRTADRFYHNENMLFVKIHFNPTLGN